MNSLQGIPYDASSSFLRGAAPAVIREAINSPSANLAIENGLEFVIGENVRDLGDLGFSDLDPANNSSRDINSMTATVAAKLVKELTEQMLER